MVSTDMRNVILLLETTHFRNLIASVIVLMSVFTRIPSSKLIQENVANPQRSKFSW